MFTGDLSSSYKSLSWPNSSVIFAAILKIKLFQVLILPFNTPYHPPPHDLWKMSIDVHIFKWKKPPLNRHLVKQYHRSERQRKEDGWMKGWMIGLSLDDIYLLKRSCADPNFFTNSYTSTPNIPPPPKKNPSPPRSVHASTLAKCLRSRRSRVDRKPLASEEAAHAECWW